MELLKFHIVLMEQSLTFINSYKLTYILLCYWRLCIRFYFILSYHKYYKFIV